VLLDAGIEVCKNRNAGRDPEDQFEFDGYERLQADMKCEFGDIGWWLDPSTQTADDFAEMLVGQPANERRRSYPDGTTA
jgi:hypothetical protein